MLVADICEIGCIFDLYEQCQAIRRFVYRSNWEKARFMNSQNMAILLRTQVSRRRIQSFSDTRWNDCVNLFDSVLVNIPALKLFFSTSPSAEEFFEGSELDWPFLEDNLPKAIEIFRYIDNIIKKFSRADAVLGDVYSSIKKMNDTVIPQLTELALQENISVLTTRCNELLLDSYVITSALLNPSQICAIVFEDSIITRTNNPLLSEGIEFMKTTYLQFHSFFEDHPNTSEDLLKAKLEVEHATFKTQLYNSEETISQFWKRLKPMTPHLFIVAHVFSCIRPTSVDCERIFSKAKRFMRPDRCRMEPSTLDTCLFLQNNSLYFERALKTVAKNWRPY